METAEDENDGETLWDKILHDHGGVFFWAARVIMVSAVVCAIAWRPGHMERPLGGGGHGGHGPVRHFFLGVRRGPRNLIRRIWGRGESGLFRGRALSPPASQGRPQGRPGRREDTGSQGHSLAPRPRPQLVNKTLLESVEGCMQALDAYEKGQANKSVGTGLGTARPARQASVATLMAVEDWLGVFLTRTALPPPPDLRAKVLAYAVAVSEVVGEERVRTDRGSRRGTALERLVVTRTFTELLGPLMRGREGGRAGGREGGREEEAAVGACLPTDCELEPVERATEE
ncbi:hypothetical protein NSK_001337 [Nannochloropsis salina CCMP1776]|uniref:Uncharacterized protein n=1 Tax=Nannochloropsis salina CCMP1776 TaxID=1027361 RepID=A0A4D9DAE7_9STRA|nr:hypothetical protein NSK_001337 [Nannochloropsis salina CCMP1776]|eukprot:TFJ87003.1 hypothetical protein NSK_001337 [Nannochloropsis salina CCMP1776]